MRSRVVVSSSLTMLVLAVLAWSQCQAPAQNATLEASRPPSRALAPPLLRGELTLVGLVEDERGPVAGAEVIATDGTTAALGCPKHLDAPLVSCGCPDSLQHLVAMAESGSLATVTVSRTLTSTDGQFTLTGLPNQALTIWATSTAAVGLKPSVRPGTSVTLTLSAGKTIRALVASTDGEPIGVARVIASMRTQQPAFEASTTALGEVALGVVPLGQYTLIAMAPGYVTAIEEVGRGAQPLIIRLKVARVIAGRVTREAQPVNDARVTLGTIPARTTKTDPQGNFRFERVEPGSYELTVGCLKPRARQRSKTSRSF